MDNRAESNIEVISISIVYHNHRIPTEGLLSSCSSICFIHKNVISNNDLLGIYASRALNVKLKTENMSRYQMRPCLTIRTGRRHFVNHCRVNTPIGDDSDLLIGKDCMRLINGQATANMPSKSQREK